MATSPHTSLQVATGGKENELKVWDGNKLDNPVFQGKNVRVCISKFLLISVFVCIRTKRGDVTIGLHTGASPYDIATVVRLMQGQFV